MKKNSTVMRRVCCEGRVPFFGIRGDAYDCGVMLGELWQVQLLKNAVEPGETALPLLTTPWLNRLFDRFCPSLPELFRGMANGAGVAEQRLYSWSGCGIKDETKEECTSFAVEPGGTLDGQPLSGQTKDTPRDRIFRYQVLGLQVKGGLELLTLTYPGWLFGHGFAVGGCCVFRNALSCGEPRGRLPYDVWGLLVNTCPNVEDAARLTRDYGVGQGFHNTVADEHGGIIGIEAGQNGYAFLKPEKGVYVHTNHCLSGEPLVAAEQSPVYGRNSSKHRQRKMRLLLERDNGNLSAQLAYASMMDLENYPDGICSDRRGDNNVTSAAVIAESVKRRLHVVRGLPSQNWPETYELI